MSAPTLVTAPPHTLVEDVAGIAVGTFLASFGLFLLHSTSAVTGGTAGLSLLLSYAAPVPFAVLFPLVNLPFFVLASFGLFLLHSTSAVTGGTAGLSLLLSYAAPVPFAVLFPLVNLPFFVLAFRARGWSFTVRSLVAVVAVSVFSSIHAAALPDLAVAPVYAVLFGNLAAGMGILVLFRHRASLGGFGILALLLQDRFGWRAGYVQMALDVLVVLAAFSVVAPSVVALSALGAVVLNLVLSMNHRPGRYHG